MDKTARTYCSRITETCPLFTAGRKEHISLAEQQFGLFDGLEDGEYDKFYPNESEHYKRACAYEGKFWARMPLGESIFDVSVRVHQAFGTFLRDREKYGIDNIVVVCHGATMRAFVMQWLHLTPEWYANQPNPANCAIWRLNGDKCREITSDGAGMWDQYAIVTLLYTPLSEQTDRGFSCIPIASLCLTGVRVG